MPHITPPLAHGSPACTSVAVWSRATLPIAWTPTTAVGPRAAAPPLPEGAVAATADRAVRRRETAAVLLATVGWAAPSGAGVVAVGAGLPVLGIGLTMAAAAGAAVALTFLVRATSLAAAVWAAPGRETAVREAIASAERRAMF